MCDYLGILRNLKEKKTRALLLPYHTLFGSFLVPCFRSNCQATLDIHRFWQVEILSHKAPASVMYLKSRSHIIFHEARICKNTHSWIFTYNLKIWPFYFSHFPPSAQPFKPFSECFDVKVFLHTLKPLFQHAPKIYVGRPYCTWCVFFFMQQWRCLEGLWASGLVRADFKRRALKLSAIWDAEINFNVLST